MTFAQFEQLPDMLGKQELIVGEPVLLPPLDKRHSVVAIRFVELLLNRLVRERIRGDQTGYRVGPVGWSLMPASLWPDQREDDKYYLRSPMKSQRSALLDTPTFTMPVAVTMAAPK
jgi:hypothetical protein